MNVVIRIHLASLHTVELNHKLCGVDLSSLTNNIKCQTMCLLEGVSEIILPSFVWRDYNITYYIIYVL